MASGPGRLGPVLRHHAWRVAAPVCRQPAVGASTGEMHHIQVLAAAYLGAAVAAWAAPTVWQQWQNVALTALPVRQLRLHYPMRRPMWCRHQKRVQLGAWQAASARASPRCCRLPWRSACSPGCSWCRCSSPSGAARRLLLAGAALTKVYFAQQTALERAHFAAGAACGCEAGACRLAALVVPWPTRQLDHDIILLLPMVSGVLQGGRAKWPAVGVQTSEVHGLCMKLDQHYSALAISFRLEPSHRLQETTEAQGGFSD